MTDEANRQSDGPQDPDTGKVATPRPLTTAGQWRLLAVWGVAMGLAFPRPNFWPLAYVALVPLLIVSLKGEKPWRTIGVVYLASVIWWVIGLGWLIKVTVPGWIVLAAYCAMFTALLAWAVRRVERTLAIPFCLSVPVLYTAVEWLRGSILLGGFPWFHLGNSQPVWMIQIADLGSFYAVGFVVAAVNGLWLDLLMRPLVTAGPKGRRWAGSVRFGLPAVGLLLIATVAYGALRTMQLDQAVAAARTIRVAVVQTNVPQSNKDSKSWEQLLANFDQMLELAEEAAGQSPRPDLIVCPETMVPRAINDQTVRRNERAYLLRRRLSRFAQDQRIYLVVGAHAWEQWRPQPDRPQYALPARRHNAAYCLGPDGRIVVRYDKMHVVPFGEYIPGTDWLPFFKRILMALTPYRDEYTLQPGNEATVFNLPLGGSRGTWGVGPPICFEDLVTDVPRMMVWSDGNKRVDLLVNLTNDGWYPGRAEGPQHEQIARFRCVENRVPMVRSVNTGISGFIDSAGRSVGRVEVDGRLQNVAGFGSAELAADPRGTLFGRIGLLPVVICSLIGLGMLGAAEVPKFRRSR